MKKSFILHLDSLSILDEMTFEQKGILFDAIYKYQQGEEINLDFAMKMAFAPFKNQFIRDNEKYNEFKEKQSENGKKGGRPPKDKPNLETQDNPKNPSLLDETQKSLNDSVSESVKDNDSVSKSDTEEEKEKPTAADDNDDVPFFVKEQREKITPPRGAGEISREALKSDFSENDYCRMQAGREGIQNDEYEKIVNEFILEKFGLEENTKWKDIKDARSHFVRWIPYFKSKTQKQHEGSTKNTGYSNSLRSIDNKNRNAAF